jgi:hypothetical protein
MVEEKEGVIEISGTFESAFIHRSHSNEDVAARYLLKE